MSETPRIHEIATKRVFCEVDGLDRVTVQRDVPYVTVEGEALTLDVYRPAHAARLPAVLFVTGYPDQGTRRVVGCNAKDMASYTSWARLMAASGLVAVTYVNRNPTTAVHDVLGYLHAHADTLGVDTSRLGLWSCSGNVPNALAALIELGPAVACAALCYGYMLDLGDSTAVAEGAKTFRFVNPTQGRSMEDLPGDVPLLVVRAGRDETPGLNDSIDRFVEAALARNLPVTVTNHHRGPHAFDIVEDSATTRGIVTQILAFMRLHLRAA